MADANRANRPLSPFMIGPYYRPQLTSMTSIFIRITGNALLIGAFLVVWWFLAAASGPEYFTFVNAVITSWFGDLVMFGSLWALWYHALGGLRHLIFDAGYGLELKQAELMGWGMILGSVLLTLLTVVVI